MNCNNGLIVSYKRSETMKIIIADDYKDMSRKLFVSTGDFKAGLSNWFGNR